MQVVENGASAANYGLVSITGKRIASDRGALTMKASARSAVGRRPKDPGGERRGYPAADSGVPAYESRWAAKPDAGVFCCGQPLLTLMAWWRDESLNLTAMYKDLFR